MRHMSFALTTAQIRNRVKTVTRRLGWTTLKAGDRLQAIVKGQGLKKGEQVEKLCVIVVTDVRREPVGRMLMDRAYGKQEVILEGFEGHPIMGTPEGFVRGFCDHHGIESLTPVTRIAFDYV